MKDFTETWYSTASDSDRDIFKNWIKSHLAMGEIKN